MSFPFSDRSHARPFAYHGQRGGAVMSDDDHETKDARRARELVWLRRTRDLAQMLGSERDPARLPPRILDAAVELTGADRGFLVEVRGPDAGGGLQVKVLAARGFRHGGAGAEGAVSRSIVERCLREGGQAVVTSRPDDAFLTDATSLVQQGVRSVMCVPLRLRGALRGVLYLDVKGEGVLSEGDLPIVQTFATQAALALELSREAPAAEAAAPRFLVGASAPIVTLLEEVAAAARTADPVLVCGEPGTERGLVARELHAQGADAAASFKSVPAGPEAAAALLGSAGSPGLLGRPGTVFLDDVEALGAELQRVLARALHEGAFVAPGGPRKAPVRARLVAGTGVDLEERVRRGELRAELYYRLDVQRLVVPPLRQRTEDLPAVCAAIDARLGPPAVAFAPAAMDRLRRYAWPGNTVELEGEIRRLKGAGIRHVRVQDLRARIRDGRGVVHEHAGFSGRTLGEAEEELVRTAMRECNGVKARAARQLGVPRSTLYHLLDRYGLR